jgi:membrane-bound metal-dependent hydrolase YbcI (DUF457 family)
LRKIRSQSRGLIFYFTITFMPFTPFHLGAGMLVKAPLLRGFSLMVFGWSQVLMDIQPLVAMLIGKGELHGLSHTLWGATLIGIAAALTGKPLSSWLLRGFLDMKSESVIRWKVAFFSAAVGVYSHIAIDAVMHADVQPLAPLRAGNPLYGWLSIGSLQNLCLAGLLIGLAAYWLIHRFILKRPFPMTWRSH